MKKIPDHKNGLVSSKFKKPLVGFAGLTHLGINSTVASAAHDFQVVSYQDDAELIKQLKKGEPHVVEPGLNELMSKNKKKITFSSDPKILSKCDILYIAVDVPTDANGSSDLRPVKNMINTATENMNKSALMVILCQVPPGFTRKVEWPAEQLFYQVETLVFGKAVERAISPERIILGCAKKGQILDKKLLDYLESFSCPIISMNYESAELAKISINLLLASSICAANILAEICENIGADWSEIIPSLKLDERIGQFAYLKPGLGIAGGNLERDLSTLTSYTKKYKTDGKMINALINNSNHRKNWAWTMLNELVLKKQLQPNISVLGLTYKENTNSIKNSPSIALISQIADYSVTAFDPAFKTNKVQGCKFNLAKNAMASTERSDVLLVMTPWTEFSSITAHDLAKSMNGKIIIDPYRVLDGEDLTAKGFIYATLGETIRKPSRKN